MAASATRSDMDNPPLYQEVEHSRNKLNGYYLLPHYNDGIIITAHGSNLYWDQVFKLDGDAAPQTKSTGKWHNGIYYMSCGDRLWWIEFDLHNNRYAIWWNDNPYHILNQPDIKNTGVVKIPSSFRLHGTPKATGGAHVLTNNIINNKPVWYFKTKVFYKGPHWQTDDGEILGAGDYPDGESLKWNVVGKTDLDVIDTSIDSMCFSRLDLKTNIPDPRISGTYEHMKIMRNDVPRDIWYNRKKNVYIYRDIVEEFKFNVKNNKDLSSYRLFSIGSGIDVPIGTRLGYISTNELNGFKFRNDTLTPVGPNIRGKVYGIPEEAENKYSFKFNSKTKTKKKYRILKGTAIMSGGWEVRFPNEDLHLPDHGREDKGAVLKCGSLGQHKVTCAGRPNCKGFAYRKSDGCAWGKTHFDPALSQPDASRPGWLPNKVDADFDSYIKR